MQQGPVVRERPEGRLAIVGSGRMGQALAAALTDAHGPFGHGFDGVGYDTVLLAVPDGAIAAAAGAVRRGPLVGHCAGAIGLDVLAPHEAFGLHPLMTVTLAGAANRLDIELELAAWLVERDQNPRLDSLAVFQSPADQLGTVAPHDAAHLGGGILVPR